MLAWYGTSWHAGSKLTTYGFIFCKFPNCVKRFTKDVLPLPAIPRTIIQIGREFTSNESLLPLLGSLLDDDEGDPSFSKDIGSFPSLFEFILLLQCAHNVDVKRYVLCVFNLNGVSA